MSAAELPLPPAPKAATSDATHRAMQEAAEWFALLRSGEAGHADRTAWESWLAANEAHRTAWACVEQVSHRFEPIQSSVNPRSTVEVLQTAQHHALRRRVLLGLATCGGTGLLSWAVWRHTPLPAMAMAWAADHHTGVGEVRKVALSDGTRVWLGSASAFNEDYQPGLRRLRLVAGDIFIETAADAHRDFVVDTPQGRLRALGTRFNVRLEGDGQTFVAVYEGAVEVRTATSDTTRVLRASEQARFSGSGVEAPAQADPARESWTQGLLIAQDMPLGQVAAELARYRRGHLAVAPEIAGLRVFGSFPLNDTDRALVMLATVLPVQVRHTLPWWSSIEPKGKGAARSP